MKRIEYLSLWERAYLPEIVRGLSVTGYHFWRNLSIHILHAFGLAKSSQADVTVQYPEERASYPDTFRGRHRLTLGADDTANCTACFLCATACPAECIYIEAGEDPRDPDEKYADIEIAKVGELAVSREIAAVKARLQRMNPVEEQAAYNRMFGDLIVLEQRRRGLLDRAAGA